MKLTRLHLQAFGPFTDRLLELAPRGQNLTLVCGPNEAGKSATLRAISDLRFGIPLHSRDNFIHAHPELRIGGSFIDRDGVTHNLMRRKGRGATLSLLAGATEGPVSSQIEALLTCGLSKQDHDAMFGLDHARLREGGQALLNGEGEVGAALFEASAGARSVPAILERLDQSARRYFMPGARGRNARINAALRTHAEQLAAFKEALVRPTHWADLSKKHEAAAQALERLERQRRECNARLLEVRELRSVAPLLRALDQATATLLELDAVRLLAPESSLERASAEAGLADAEHNAGVAAAEVQRQQALLDALAGDETVLELGTVIDRMAVAAESFEQHQNDLALASADAADLDDRVTTLALQIDANAAGDAAARMAVLACIPTPASRAGIEQLLETLVACGQALVQHRDAAARQVAETTEAAPAPLASADARIALRSALTEMARCDALLQKAASMLTAVRAAQRAVDTLLAEIGLSEAEAVNQVRTLLDGEIDAAIQSCANNSARRQEFDQRIDAISTALRNDHAERDRLLAAGAVATRDEVIAARGHRQQGWLQVRSIYIDVTPAAPRVDTGSILPQAYEQAVQQADAIIDALARDTARAAQLQACLHRAGALEADRQVLQEAAAALAASALQHEQAWGKKLAACRLPPLGPAALREWQQLLARARIACEKLQAAVDEATQAEQITTSLRAVLHAAIVATGLAEPAPAATLATLAALAAEIEAALKQHDRLQDTAAGKRQEQAQQRLQMVERETVLTAAFAGARVALQPALSALLLPEQAVAAVVRARLGEFDALAAALERRNIALISERRARDALARLQEQARVLARSLGEAPPDALRSYVEHLTARLARARAVQTRQSIAAQALATALAAEQAHLDTRTRHVATLAHLCQAAAVDHPAQLPQAEQQSQRRREAQAAADRSQAQLAQASRHAPQVLCALLAEQDSDGMDGEEAACNRSLTLLEEQLAAAREDEESARHALAAVDCGDAAVVCREGMESAVAGVHASIAPWMRSRLAHGLLGEALKRFRERAQGPMLLAASTYFARMTGGEFVRLVSDDTQLQPVLMAQRRTGAAIHVEAMSEGTRDQLYLALRLAALALRRSAGVDLPVLLDDVLMTSDDGRAGLMLHALAEFSRGSQVIVFTHHAHLIDVAQANLDVEVLSVVRL